MIEYAGNTFLILKALHIIFMVSYFAGLFYLLRLFVYFKEAETKDGKGILQAQFREMIKKLWNIIILPAGIIMLITGVYMLSASYAYLLKQPWMHIKLTLLLLFLGFHLFSWRETRSVVRSGMEKYSSLQLRKFNEIPTLFLFAIVFVVVLKSKFIELFPELMVGFIVLIIVIFVIIKLVNRKKNQ